MTITKIWLVAKFIYLVIIFYFVLRGVLGRALYYAGLEITSPAFASALCNLIPSMTFILAVLFRYVWINQNLSFEYSDSCFIFNSLYISLQWDMLCITFMFNPKLKKKRFKRKKRRKKMVNCKLHSYSLGVFGF